MSFMVKKPGLATTVQDLGRPGFFHLGIPLSGAMDQTALRTANLLVGNDEGAAGLEIVFMGPELVFEQDTLLAVTGGEIPPRVDGAAQPTWTTFAVKAGQTLSFDFLKSGARAYLAIAGGIDVPEALGSRSTYALGTLGGFEGRKLAVGDVVPVGSGSMARAGASLDPSLRPELPADVRLRALPGQFWDRITETAQAQFFEDTWKVAPEADRIGYRFKGGRPLEFVPREAPFGAGSDPSNIVDGCYSYGSIQIPGGTEPIVLHRDAVSGGGYFMPATVISADMDVIAQLQPHKPVRFERVDMEEALAARAAYQGTMEAIRKALG